jgi:hypothetical protein
VNTDDCDEVKDLFDDTKNYLKTVCLVASAKTHDEADEYCTPNYMFLLYLDMSEAQKALFDFLNSRFKKSAGLLHMQGKTNEGCSVLSNEKGSFDVGTDLCNSRYYFICEFSRDLITVEPGSSSDLSS